jgi:DNA-binding HxlR family transcriptional regulator
MEIPPKTRRPSIARPMASVLEIIGVVSCNMQVSCKQQAYIDQVTICHSMTSEIVEPEFTRMSNSEPVKHADFCPVVESLHIVGNEKKLVIIRFLLDRPMRFNQLLRAGLDSKTLSRALKSMETQGLVNRAVISTQPFSVEYSLTEKGRDLKPVIDSLRNWAERWVTAPSEQSSPIEIESW